MTRIAGTLSMDGSSLKLDQGATESTTITSNSPAAATTLTLPNATATIPGIGLAQTWSATQTFGQTNVAIQGGDSNALTLKPNETLTGAKTLNLKVNDTDRTVDLGGDLTLAGSLTTTGSFNTTFAQGASVTITLPTATSTLATLGETETLVGKTLTSPVINGATTLSLQDNGTNDLIFNSSDGSLSADRTLNIDMTNADRTLDLAGNLVLANSFTTSGGHAVTFTTTGTTSVTLPTSGTLAANTAATADAAGIVTSFVPVIKSSVKDIGDAAYTVTDSDGFEVIKTDATALTANRTVTLPTAADNTGRRLTFKKGDTGSFDFIVDGEGAETIDGVATKTLSTQYDTFTLVCDGDEWHTVSFSLVSTDSAGMLPEILNAGSFASDSQLSGVKQAGATASLADGVQKTVTSITLDAGNWLIMGHWYTAGSSGMTRYVASLSLVDDTHETDTTFITGGPTIAGAPNGESFTFFKSLAASDTLYLVVGHSNGATVNFDAQLRAVRLA